MIKAVTLDFWGTLMLDGPGSDERYTRQRLTSIERLLAEAGMKVPRQNLERAYDAAGRRIGRIWQTCQDVPVREHVISLLEAVDPELLTRLDSTVLASLIDAYSSPALVVPPVADDGAGPALAALVARGLKLGIVSNIMRTPGAVLRKLLDRAGLLAPFTVLTFSDECGVRKPDPEIFRLTLERLGVAPEEAVHVGDDLVLDVEGARAAGMRVIQIVPNGRATGPMSPDAVITGLRELPAALAGLEF